MTNLWPNQVSYRPQFWTVEKSIYLQLSLNFRITIQTYVAVWTMYRCWKYYACYAWPESHTNWSCWLNTVPSLWQYRCSSLAWWSRDNRWSVNTFCGFIIGPNFFEPIKQNGFSAYMLNLWLWSPLYWIILRTAHWLACFWYLIGISELNSKRGIETGVGWLYELARNAVAKNVHDTTEIVTKFTTALKDP